MEDLILYLLSTVVFFAILYFVVKAAVRNGMLEAQDRRGSDGPESEGSGISQVTCSRCGHMYDMDYPKCPYCRHMPSSPQQ